MTRCKLQNRPSVTIVQLRLICLFCVNLVRTSWYWTWSAIETWKRFFKRKFGQEISEDAKFTKPKHRIIADAYAKRRASVIAISYGKSYGDPAGINFDMNNLNITKSDAMGATLTNYLPNIINRRNAVTSVDFKDQSASCTSSCAEDKSEISLNVRQVSYESRRNSIDSQVSQVSFKLSATNIKVNSTVNTQKHIKGCKVNTKRRHRHISKRTTRRASSSSVESQRITNQMKQFKYKYPGFQVSANSVNRQIERRSACTTDDINAMHLLHNHLKRIQLTSDEDQRNDESQIMHIANEPANLLDPFVGHAHQLDDSGDSLKEALRNSSEKQFEDLIKMVKKIESERKHRYGQNNIHPRHMNDELDLNSSVSSTVEVECLQLMNGDQDSISDQSLNRVKTQSQNSKHSCDVGIQANDYDISTRRQHPSHGDYGKDHLPEKPQLTYRQQDEEYTETHQLLPTRKRDAPSIVRRENLGSKHLSKSQRNELVNKLLLP